jgi:hypothetical protein
MVPRGRALHAADDSGKTAQVKSRFVCAERVFKLGQRDVEALMPLALPDAREK